jgi:hypothetical protein
MSNSKGKQNRSDFQPFARILLSSSSDCKDYCLPVAPSASVNRNPKTRSKSAGVPSTRNPVAEAQPVPQRKEDASPHSAAETSSPEHVLLFTGQRIPSLVLTKKGTLLAFCSVGDNHPGGAFVRRSEDNGKTWGEKIAITPDGRKLRTQFASVSVVADRETGILWLYEGKTWKPEDGKILKEGGVAYSDLAVLPDMTVGCLYESNKPWHSIYFTRFSLEWLTDGRDRITRGKQAAGAGN